MEILEAIKTKGIDTFVSENSLIMRTHKEFNNLISLTYHQTETKKTTATNQARGIVINTVNNNVVCYPFYRFGDYDWKKEINLSEGKLYEKIDGSLVTLYYYNKWNVSTKGTPDGSGKITRNEDKTFSSYFLDIFTKNYDINTLDKTKNYIFEFKFPSNNHHLIKANKETITLIGVRDMITLKEISITEYSEIFTLPKEKTFANLVELKRYIYNLNPMESEGFVFVSNALNSDGNFERLKIKSPQFDLLQNLRENESKNYKMNYSWLYEICVINQHRDFLNKEKFNSFSDMVYKIDTEINLLIEESEKYKHLTNQKEIGLLNTPQIIKTWLFKKLKGENKTFKEFLAKI